MDSIPSRQPASNSFFLRFKILFAIWTNTVYKLDKCTFQAGLNTILTTLQQFFFSEMQNTFCNLDKYSSQIRQIHIPSWTQYHPDNPPAILFSKMQNTFCNSDKYRFQMGQIHFANQTNTFCNFPCLWACLNQQMSSAVFTVLLGNKLGTKDVSSFGHINRKSHLKRPKMKIDRNVE